jgi:hypothetical protein
MAPLLDAGASLSRLELRQTLASKHWADLDLRISPYDVINLVAETLDGSRLRVMEAAAVLLPKPDSCTARDVVKLLGSQIDEQAATAELEELRRHCLVELVSSGGDDVDDASATATPGGGAHSRRYQLNEATASYFAARMEAEAPDGLVALRGHAVKCFEQELEPGDEDVESPSGETDQSGPSEIENALEPAVSESWDGAPDASRQSARATPWVQAHRLESERWQRAARQLVNQLGRLDDRTRARVVFDYVYLDLIWWYGFYVPDQRPKDLIEGWRRVGRRPEDREWFEAIAQFDQALTPAYNAWSGGEPTIPHYDRTDWSTAGPALAKLKEFDELGIDPAQSGEPREHAFWHARAVIDIFLAYSQRFAKQPDFIEAKRLLVAAAKLIEQKCPKRCKWNLSWLEYELADLALDVEDAAEAVDHSRNSLALALGDAGATVAKIVERRSELSYEILANCMRIRAQMASATDRWAALEAYKSAGVFAYAFQFWPQPPDEYTIAFYGEMIARTLDLLEEWLGVDPAEADQAAAALVEFGRQRYPIEPAALNQPVPILSSSAKGEWRALMIERAFAPRPVPFLESARLGAEEPPKVPPSFDEEVKRQIEQLVLEVMPNIPTE